MPADLPILYSFVRCPYAMRARLALAVSRQAWVLREVDLKNRPPELYAASAKGTVPVLVLTDGQVIEESLEIMRWTLSRHDPENWLLPADGDLKAMDELIAFADGEFKHNLDRYKYAYRYQGAVASEHRAVGAEFLHRLDHRLQQDSNLCGAYACLADMALAPFVRQYSFTDRDWFDAQSWSSLRTWLDNILAGKLFVGIMGKHQAWDADAEPLVVDWTAAGNN